MNNKLRSTPIIGFFIRYWPLTLFTIFCDWLALNDTAFLYVGSLVYVTAKASTAWWTLIFLRHIFFQSTLDPYAATGLFVTEWEALTPERRQVLTAAYFIGGLLAIAILSQTVGK